MDFGVNSVQNRPQIFNNHGTNPPIVRRIPVFWRIFTMKNRLKSYARTAIFLAVLAILAVLIPLGLFSVWAARRIESVLAQ